MNWIISQLSGDACGKLVLALLHTLWQSAVIAALLYVFLRSGRAKDANRRYISAVVALAAVVICGLFTWAVLSYEHPNAQANGKSVLTSMTGTAPASGTSNFATVEPSEGPQTRTSTQMAGGANWHTWLMVFWLLGVVIMIWRMVWMIIGIGRLRKECRPLEDESISGLIEELRQTIGIAKRIRVAIGERICVPGAIGFVWPTLLLPASMITGVCVDDLKAILSHELAHIRRHDYLINFCQMIVEAILFFNPAVWWISRQVRIEREACCDSIGIAVTGQRVKYAQVLTDWAGRLNGRKAERLAPAMIGFSKTDDSGSVLDRVKRIVVAGHRPRVRASWYVTTTMLAVSGLVLVGLWGGTKATVALAAKILTPAERMEEIAKIQKTHGIDEREYGPQDKITISGVVKTWDGQKLPDNCQMSIKYQRPHHGGTIGIGMSSSGPFSSEGTFSHKIEFGTVRISVTAPGYAPAFVGPFKTKPGGKIEDIELLLDKGFKGRIKVVDESGQPVPQARLTGGYLWYPGGYHHSIGISSDSEGLATVEDASDRPVGLEIRADGYEHDKRQDIQLSPDKAVLWELKRAKKTTGIVMSEKTNKPIAGAQIRVLTRVGGRLISHSYGRQGAPVLATTDHQGQFTLDTLRRDCKYILSVESPNHVAGILCNVTADQKDLKMYLRANRHIAGRIIGPLEKLHQQRGKPVIRYGGGLVFDHEGHWGSGKYANVEIADGVGHFEIASQDLWGNRLSIGSGGYRMVLDIEKELPDEVVIDLGDKVFDGGKDYKNRTVVVKFDYPKGMPPPRGTIRTHYYMGPDFASHTYKYKQRVVQDGVARYDISSPGKIKIDAQGILGYWFADTAWTEVPYGDEPFEIVIPVVPAGSIYGEVFESNGGQASGVMVSVTEIEKSPSRPEGFLHVRGKTSASPSDENAKYMLAPLPLGGTYMVVARQGASYVASEPVKLDKHEPIRQINLKLVQGVDVKGRILGSDGEPMAGVGFRLNYDSGNHGFGGSRRSTDRDGRFVIEHVNPDISGSYRITIEMTKDYRPVRLKLVDLRKPVTIRLEKGHVVSGVVIDDETGEPMSGVEVYALPKNYSHPESTGALEAEGKTDEQGRFRFSTMGQLGYQLGTRGAQRNKRRYRSRSVAVMAGQPEQVTIRMKPRN